MGDTRLTCETCRFWHADPGAYVGDCAMQVVYHRPAFNYAPPGGCQYHSEIGVAPPALSQQSQTRGATAYELWKKAMGGK